MSRLPTPAGQHCTAWSLRFSPRGTLLAAGDDGAFWLWDAETGAFLASLYVPDLVEHLAISPDDRYIAGGLLRLTVYDRHRLDLAVVTCADYQPYVDACFRAHPSDLTDLEFSPDGRYLATCGKDAIAHVWETGTWRLVAAFLILPDDQNAPSDQWISWNDARILSQSEHASDWLIPGSSLVRPAGP
jgi:WD40 repeat protein